MHSAYHFEWYKCNVNVQKSLLLVIHRSQYYTGINAPFFETNLSTFTSVIIIVVGISFTIQRIPMFPSFRLCAQLPPTSP